MNIQSVLLLAIVIAAVIYVCWRLFVKKDIKTCCGDVNGKCSQCCKKHQCNRCDK